MDYSNEDRNFRLIINSINDEESKCFTIHESVTITGLGKRRPTFKMEKPAAYVTFNSITDNPDWGDERGFVVIKDVTGLPNDGMTAASGGFAELATAVAGNIYMIKMFIHNNAADNYNLVAENTRILVGMPTISGNSIMIQGQIAADNCGSDASGAPGATDFFWDEAYLISSNSFSVFFISGSARYYNNVRDFSTSGFTLPNTLVSAAGASVGYTTMDGKVRGCFQYSGYATFLVTVKESTSNS